MKKKKEEIKVEEIIKEEPKIEIKEVPENYILRMGETLESVATKFGLDANRLKELNGEVIATNQIKLK